ncbi:SIR2 family protein [Nocardioides dongxiaopingii]|uniref:SIR2 family NAD-dependent protein deacylase n=1 Tax=Nocardioides sp. S-1144 TaxID=2582905 RepID=UPI00110D4BFE|nr:SIR2 family protein [Nocardioides sp. S-1144]QCW51519.1 SIR2 family protein [Nocardioides sp. S-1144]
MSGHLFVAHGDLTRLACDAIVVPCDGAGNVSDSWAALLPPDLPRGDGPGWLRVGSPDAAGAVDLGTHAGRRVVALDTVSGAPSPADLAARTWAAVDRLGPGLTARDGRRQPLVALPLVGTGDGGLAGRRGEVVAALLERRRERTPSVDVALVLRDRRDVAAVQARRVDADWDCLPPHLRGEADRLGTLAGEGRLSLFLGAGVSMPVGLPDWWSLLGSIAAEEPVVDLAGVDDPLDAASRLVRSRGAEPFLDAVVARVSTDRHGIGHALLGGLGVRQSVTTNFDACFETALHGVRGDDVDVLTRSVADGSRPWLLKLHGDVAVPSSLVLTSEQYAVHAADHQALDGVVQALLLTSHLLFVGFSLTDANFLRLARQVDVVRAESAGARTTPSGTALALTTRDVTAAGYQGLTMLPMSPGLDRPAAGRVLEIFLDRLAWTAARAHDLSSEYLLDERYASGLSAADRVLKQHLLALAARPGVTDSEAWPEVRRLLHRLGGGADER